MAAETPITRLAETSLPETTVDVAKEWVDYNGHMNLAYYVLAFDRATDTFYDHLGIGLDYRQAHDSSMFTVAINVDYMREVFAGNTVRITTQLLEQDAKRLRYIHMMYEGEDTKPVASNECLAVHVDMSLRRSTAFPPEVQARVAQVAQQHSQFRVPDRAGRVLGVARSGRL